MNRNLAYVALGFVTLLTGAALGVIWGVGNRMGREFAKVGVALPAPTQLAFDSRTILTGLVFAVFASAVMVHRQQHAVRILLLLALFQLSLSAAFGWALWLPLSTPVTTVSFTF